MLNVIQELKLMGIVIKISFHLMLYCDGMEWHCPSLKLLLLYFSHRYRAISD